MVSIRNGRKRPSSSWMLHLPLVIGVFLIAIVSFYGGIWVGMRLSGAAASSSSSSLRSETNRAAGGDAELEWKSEFGREEFEKRVEAEVTKRLAARRNDHDRDGDGDGDGDGIDALYTDKSHRPRRFPTSIRSFAAGAAIVPKRDFLARFDYGIPMPPSKREDESDPGKDDVLLLYGSDKALPDGGPDAGSADPVYYHDNNDNDNDHDRDRGAPRSSHLPHLSAADATANCSGLNVLFTDSHADIHQCTAIVGNYESYHVQRWLRMNPSKGFSKLDPQLPLHPVGRGLQTNGQDKFSAPEDKYALQNQELLITYFDRLEATLADLRPLARECAGRDNTVVVMVCNTGQSDLLINFVCSAEARGFGDVVRDKVLVFATDRGVYDIATGLGLRAFYDEKIFEQMPEKEAGMYGDKSFTAMMWSKVVTVQLVNRLGHDVLFQDVDLVWYKVSTPHEYFPRCCILDAGFFISRSALSTFHTFDRRQPKKYIPKEPHRVLPRQNQSPLRFRHALPRRRSQKPALRSLLRQHRLLLRAKQRQDQIPLPQSSLFGGHGSQHDVASTGPGGAVGRAQFLDGVAGQNVECGGLSGGVSLSSEEGDRADEGYRGGEACSVPFPYELDNQQEKQITLLETNGTVVHSPNMRRRWRRRRGKDIQWRIDYGIILLFGGTIGVVSLF